MIFFKKRRELIQEVKYFRNLYNDALEEIKDLRETAFNYQLKLQEAKKKEPVKKEVKKVTKKAVKKEPAKKVSKKTTTRKGVKGK